METKAASAIHEVLDKDNYVDWSVRVKTYLMAQDLWDIVDATTEPPSQEHNEAIFRAWSKKNSIALHVIQISCGSYAFSNIREISSAKGAWDTLKEKYVPKNTGMYNESNDYHEYMGLTKILQRGEKLAAINFFMCVPDATHGKITSFGQTALHIASAAGHLPIVEVLMAQMSEEDLEITDNKGNTALFDALFNGDYKVAKCMLRKNKKLAKIPNASNILPVVIAIQFGYTELADELYYLTPPEDLRPENGVNVNGATLCTQAIYSRKLDIALDLIKNSPRLALALDKEDCSPLYALSAMPQGQGDRLVFLKQWIYSLSHPPISNRLELSGIKHSYEMEFFNTPYHDLLRRISNEIKDSSMEERQKAHVDGAIFCAIKNGNFEFLHYVLSKNLDLLRILDKESRNIFLLAVLHRQAKIFSLFYRLEVKNVTSTDDSDLHGNLILHMAGMSSDSTLLRIPGAALQMQRELQWFKEVESLVHPKFKKVLNKDGLTARELFTRSHKDMMQAGEQWMKDTAKSCTVVAAFMVTMMFAAAFTIPGGDDQDGYPKFSHENLFKVFIICDALSLLSSSTSVFMFLGILTSRYAEQDFLKSLPRKMIIGLSTLFLSITTMMIAFSARLLMLRGQLGLVIPIICLATAPAILFIWIQLPLLVDMSISTFGPSILGRKKKKWYN